MRRRRFSSIALCLWLSAVTSGGAFAPPGTDVSVPRDPAAALFAVFEPVTVSGLRPGINLASVSLSSLKGFQLQRRVLLLGLYEFFKGERLVAVTAIALPQAGTAAKRDLVEHLASSTSMVVDQAFALLAENVGDLAVGWRSELAQKKKDDLFFLRGNLLVRVRSDGHTALGVARDIDDVIKNIPTVSDLAGYGPQDLKLTLSPPAVSVGKAVNIKLALKGRQGGERDVRVGARRDGNLREPTLVQNLDAHPTSDNSYEAHWLPDRAGRVLIDATVWDDQGLSASVELVVNVAKTPPR